jgi:hypothetical protein
MVYLGGSFLFDIVSLGMNFYSLQYSRKFLGAIHFIGQAPVYPSTRLTEIFKARFSLFLCEGK